MTDPVVADPVVTGSAKRTPGIAVLQRWEQSGAVWEVLSRTGPETGNGESVMVSLMTCSAGQEVDRLVTDEPDVLDFVGNRTRSDE